MAIAQTNIAVLNADGTEQNAPKVPNTNDAPVSGGPTTPALSRGTVANTSIAFSNSNLAHVCDISPTIKYEIAKLTMSVTGLIQTIRTEIEALWASSTSSPFADEIRTAIKTIKAKIKTVQKFIRDQLAPIEELQKFIAQLQELIVFIATLPARIASILQQCLSSATSGISEAIDLGKQIQSQVQNGTISKATADIALQEAIASSTEKEVVQDKPVFQKP